MKEAEFYETAESEAVICGLCPHRCKISDGKTGICGVRKNENGTLYAESYGRVTAIALDPIEKKPLYFFHPGSKILSTGSYGCNFTCRFCQNHHISMARSETGAVFDALSPEEIAEAAVSRISRGNIGVAYTYNEPLISYEFVRDCAVLVREKGLKNVLVTNGYICREPLEQMLPLIDAMNIDLKSFGEKFYSRVGGSLEDVKETIKAVYGRCHLEVTTLVIPGENDSEEEMYALSGWLSEIDPDIPFHISRFFPRYKMADRQPTPVETIHTLVKTAEKNLRRVFAGNC